jgi:hypothetical protein
MYFECIEANYEITQLQEFTWLNLNDLMQMPKLIEGPFCRPILEKLWSWNPSQLNYCMWIALLLAISV